MSCITLLHSLELKFKLNFHLLLTETSGYQHISFDIFRVICDQKVALLALLLQRACNGAVSHFDLLLGESIARLTIASIYRVGQAVPDIDEHINIATNCGENAESLSSHSSKFSSPSLFIPRLPVLHEHSLHIR